MAIFVTTYFPDVPADLAYAQPQPLVAQLRLPVHNHVLLLFFSNLFMTLCLYFSFCVGDDNFDKFGHGIVTEHIGRHPSPQCCIVATSNVVPRPRDCEPRDCELGIDSIAVTFICQQLQLVYTIARRFQHFHGFVIVNFIRCRLQISWPRGFLGLVDDVLTICDNALLHVETFRLLFGVFLPCVVCIVEFWIFVFVFGSNCHFIDFLDCAILIVVFLMFGIVRFCLERCLQFLMHS
jgi:hypothetical protein